MTYIRVEQAHTDDERWIEAGADAFALHIAALVYCDRLLTDGRISAVMALRVSLAVPTDRAKAAVDVLVNLGFWIKCGEGYRIENYDSYAFPAEQIKRTRERWTNDKRRKSQHDIGDHGLCKDPKFCPAIREGSTVESGVDSATESSVDAHAYTKPNRTKPNPTEGRGFGVGSAHAATPSARRSHDPQGKNEDGGLTWTDESMGGVMTVVGEVVTLAYFEGGTTSSPRRDWQMEGGKIPPDATPLTWTVRGDCQHQAHGLDLSDQTNSRRCDICSEIEVEMDGTLDGPPYVADPWTLNGDCEHREGGMDRSRVLGKLRCKQCDKHEKAQAKAREIRNAS
jgi:hypothetical protein